jgi:hypothetical protein
MTKPTFAAFSLLLMLTTSASAHPFRGPATGEVGREVAAPSWSAACMTDHGPSECDQPMWVYGSPKYVSRFKSAF